MSEDWWYSVDVWEIDAGGNEYGQCGEEPERKDDTGRPLRRDIVTPKICAPKLVVRQVIFIHANVWNYTRSLSI